MRVVLWYRLAGWRRFHPPARTTTDASGRYGIMRPAGRMQTNQAWYVVAGGLRSRTLNERVHALVVLNVSGTAAVPGEPVRLTGHVTPSHGAGAY